MRSPMLLAIFYFFKSGLLWLASLWRALGSLINGVSRYTILGSFCGSFGMFISLDVYSDCMSGLFFISGWLCSGDGIMLWFVDKSISLINLHLRRMIWPDPVILIWYCPKGSFSTTVPVLPRLAFAEFLVLWITLVHTSRAECSRVTGE